MKTFEETYKKRIETVFDEYKEKIKDSELTEILKRNYVWSKVDSSAKILICGINPSYRKEDILEPYPFNFNEVCQTDSYYKTRYDLLPKSHAQKATYIDMLVQRHSNQKDLLKFCSKKNKFGIDFIAQQLEITKEVIEHIQPTLILVFNRFASNFWGLHPKRKADGKFDNIWLGYTFEDNNDGSYTIKKEMQKESIGNKIETTLAGTKIYFSKHIDWRVSKDEYNRISENVSSLIKKYCHE